MKLPCAPFSSRVRSLFRLSLFLFLSIVFLCFWSVSMRPFPAGPKHSGAKVGQPLFRKTSRRTTRNVNRFRHPFKVSKKGLVIFTNEEKEESSVCLKRAVWTFAVPVHGAKEAKGAVSITESTCVCHGNTEKGTPPHPLSTAADGSLSQPPMWLSHLPPTWWRHCQRHRFTATQEAWPEIATHVVLRVSLLTSFRTYV